MCLPNTKRIFSRTRKMMFSLWLKWLRFNCFWECRFWRYQRWQFENNNFSKKICYGSFRYLSALRKNVFSGAPLKYVFLYGSNNSDFVVFWNLAFGEIKNHSQRTTLFQKKIVMEVLGLHLPYIKRYFQKHQLSASYFLAQVTQILLFSGILLLERSKITVRERHLFKINCYGSFGFPSTLHKKVISEAPVKCVLLYDWNNSDSVVFRNAAFREIKDHSLRMTPFQNKICYGSFGFVCTLHKKVFSGAPFNCVFLYGSNKSDSVVFGNADFAVIKYHSLSTIDF